MRRLGVDILVLKGSMRWKEKSFLPRLGFLFENLSERKLGFECPTRNFNLELTLVCKVITHFQHSSRPSLVRPLLEWMYFNSFQTWQFCLSCKSKEIDLSYFCLSVISLGVILQSCFLLYYFSSASLSF